MNKQIKKVEPQKDYTLILTLSNGKKKLFDVKPYLKIGIFKELFHPLTFSKIELDSGGVHWNHRQDLSNDTLLIKSSNI